MMNCKQFRESLDCYLDEPPIENPLLFLQNIITTPHIGSYSYESVLEMGLCSVDNLIKALEGKVP